GGRLDVCTTAGFGNLRDLGPRLLSIGVNRDVGQTHSLLLKGDGAAQGIRLTEAQLIKRTTRFRDLLERATYRPGKKARFETEPAADTPPGPDFAQVVAELAEFGRDAYRPLYTA